MRIMTNCTFGETRRAVAQKKGKELRTVAHQLIGSLLEVSKSVPMSSLMLPPGGSLGAPRVALQGLHPGKARVAWSHTTVGPEPQFQGEQEMSL